MDTPTIVAARLGTSRPRVVRTARRLGIGSRTPGGHWRFAADEVDRLSEALGTRATAGGRDLSAIELDVLGALQRSPRGALSARAVARRAGRSPTATAGALRDLEADRLVQHLSRTVAEGRAHRAAVWQLNHHSPRWPPLAAALAAITPRASDQSPTPWPTVTRLPSRFSHLFWNIDVARLDIERDATLIARRIITSDDLDAHAWAARHLPTDAWKEIAAQRRLDPRRRALARNLAAAGRSA